MNIPEQTPKIQSSGQHPDVDQSELSARFTDYEMMSYFKPHGSGFHGGERRQAD
jgi:hypothetical protein